MLGLAIHLATAAQPVTSNSADVPLAMVLAAGVTALGTIVASFLSFRSMRSSGRAELHAQGAERHAMAADKAVNGVTPETPTLRENAEATVGEVRALSGTVQTILEEQSTSNRRAERMETTIGAVQAQVGHIAGRQVEIERHLTEQADQRATTVKSDLDSAATTVKSDLDAAALVVKSDLDGAAATVKADLDS